MRKTKFKQLLLIVIFLFINLLTCCSGCSRSGINNSKIKNHQSSSKIIENNGNDTKGNGTKTSIKMEDENGVKYVWIEINKTIPL